MLARSFLGAEKLGLKEKHYEALLKCLKAMETGKLYHVSKDAIVSGTVLGRRKFCGAFNMAVWMTHMDCGSIACIGGTAELLGGLRHHTLASAAEENRELYILLYPATRKLDLLYQDGSWEQHAVEWEDITLAQATRALQNYLSTGKANWKEVFETVA